MLVLRGKLKTRIIVHRLDKVGRAFKSPTPINKPSPLSPGLLWAAKTYCHTLRDNFPNCREHSGRDF